MLGTPLKGRVNGTDLFESLCEKAAEYGIPIFLLGGNPGTARDAGRVLNSRHPDLEVAGYYCPPFGFEDDEEECERIRLRVRESDAKLLFVGLGAPKQEFWMADQGKDTGVRHAVGVGFSFSFVSGEVKRAPPWMQKHGLEWAYRLLREPTRLWRRYLIQDLPFVWLVAEAALFGRNKPDSFRGR
jgi:N-acetylglucosaminyldiphosphoundecaprenol N-acetyl-beta-D-mannosaminyltransferase